MAENQKREFARLLPKVDSPPPADAMALGHMMRDWLEVVVADAGTSVDTGGGFGCYDLWVNVGGKTMFVQIQCQEVSNA